MRQAGTIPNETDARRLVDFLLTVGIEAQAEPNGSDGWGLWIVDEASVPRGKEDLARFLAQPNDAKYVQAAKAAAELRQQEAQRRKQAARNLVDVSRRWNAPLARRAPVTIVVIGLCVVVALLTGLGGKPEPIMPWLRIKNVQVVGDSYRWVGQQLDEVMHGQVWRLFTPALLHFGLVHLICNVLSAYTLGGLLEMRKGSLWMAMFVLIVAAVSNVIQFEAKGPIFGGLSGVVFGMFGYAWMKSRYFPQDGIWISPNSVVWMLLFFAACAVGVLGPIANWAHGAGLVTGGALAFLPDWRLGRRR